MEKNAQIRKNNDESCLDNLNNDRKLEIEKSKDERKYQEESPRKPKNHTTRKKNNVYQQGGRFF